MAVEWYFMSGGKPKGPFSQARLKQALAAGKLPADILVWHDQMPNWLPANTLPEFAPPPPQQEPEPAEISAALAAAAPVPPATNGHASSAASSEAPAAEAAFIFSDDATDEPSYTTPPPISEPPPLPHGAATSQSGNSVSRTATAYLKSIRRTTCYPALRLVINVCFWIGIVFAAAALVAGICRIILGLIDRPDAALDGFLVFALAILAISLLIAGRDGAVLLVDIADSLLHHHAKTEEEAE